MLQTQHVAKLKPFISVTIVCIHGQNHQDENPVLIFLKLIFRLHSQATRSTRCSFRSLKLHYLIHADHLTAPPIRGLTRSLKILIHISLMVVDNILIIFGVFRGLGESKKAEIFLFAELAHVLVDHGRL